MLRDVVEGIKIGLLLGVIISAVVILVFARLKRKSKKGRPESLLDKEMIKTFRHNPNTEVFVCSVSEILNSSTTTDNEKAALQAALGPNTTGYFIAEVEPSTGYYLHSEFTSQISDQVKSLLTASGGSIVFS